MVYESTAYDSPSSVLAVGIVFPLLGLVAVTLRLFTRQLQSAPILKDDLLAVIATVSKSRMCRTYLSFVGYYHWMWDSYGHWRCRPWSGISYSSPSYEFQAG
jgi:hypothetical protein